MSTINFERLGSGPPLVLLHGLGAEWYSWAPVLDALAERHELFVVDLPGFGESPPLPDGVRTTIRALTDAVERLLDDEGLERPALAGFSTGGGIALDIARRGRASSVTAISPIGFWTDAERLFCQLSMRVTRVGGSLVAPLAPALMCRPRGRELLLAQLFARPRGVPAGDALRAARMLRVGAGFHPTNNAFSGYRFERPEELDAVPVTVAWGARDRLLIPREGRRVPQLLPQARFVWLEGCGHVPFHDDPQLVARVLLEGAARGSSSDQAPALAGTA